LVFLETLVQDTVLVLLCEELPYIWNFLDDNFAEEGHKFGQHRVIHVVVPRLYPDAIIRSRVLKVFSQVVHDNGSFNRTTKLVQVFDGVVLVRRSVLSVEPVGYTLPISIDAVENPVGILRKERAGG